jgi:hypothetical protein
MGQPAENVIHRDPHPANAGFPIPLVRFDSNARVDSRHKPKLIIAQALVPRFGKADDTKRSSAPPRNKTNYGASTKTIAADASY